MLAGSALLVLTAAACDKRAADSASTRQAEGADAAGGEQAACVELGCLAGARFRYVPDREWQRSAASPAVPSDELAEAEYSPLRDASHVAVQFSSDGARVDLAPAVGGDFVSGTRLADHDGAYYELDLFAGGRFVVQPGTTALQAEYTVYGSGVPIVSSTRGTLAR